MKIYAPKLTLHVFVHGFLQLGNTSCIKYKLFFCRCIWASGLPSKNEAIFMLAIRLKSFGFSCCNPTLLTTLLQLFLAMKLSRVSCKKKLEDSECVTTADFLIPKAYQDQIEGGTLTEIQPGSVPVKGSWSRFPSPQRCALHSAHKLHTCWWPSLDVASAMDNSILCFTFFYRAQAIPKWKGNTQIQIHTNNVNWHAE